MNERERQAGRIKRIKGGVLAASIVGLGVLTVAAEHHVTGVTSREQEAALQRGLGVGPAPTANRSGGSAYAFGQPVDGGSTTAPVTSTGVS